jgi:apolipoprotein N-acyltransferase
MTISALAGRMPQTSIWVAVSQSVTLSDGWSRRAVAFASGGFGALAMAPFNIFPALVLTFCVAVWLLDGAAQKGAHSRWNLLAPLATAAFDGWWLGFGYFVAGLWWLGEAFLIEADRFAWAMPLGVVGLPAVLALFTASGFAIARLLWVPGAPRVIALAVGLFLSEWLRGHVFTGFPWNLFGMALGGNLVLAQAASLIGVYGLTLLTLLIFATPATLATSLDKPSARRFTVLAMAVMAALPFFGAIRLGLGMDPGVIPGVKLRIMQPNLSQDAKFRPEYRDAILTHYLELSDRATSPQTSGLNNVTHLVWPESAFPFILGRDAQALSRIGAALPPQTTLMTGAARMDPPIPGPPNLNDVYNSVQVIASGGTILDSSDKTHLVPFGEYLPFSSLLNGIGLRQFVSIPGGFASGLHRKALRVPALPLVSPLVCYEAIFSAEVLPEVWPSRQNVRPGILLNVTNDGWFGRFGGPQQHFAQARLRSIEEGLPLIRAANTGISAVVDPYGRVLSELPVGIEGVLDSEVPNPLPPTLFAKWGNFPALGMFLLLFGISLANRLRL